MLSAREQTWARRQFSENRLVLIVKYLCQNHIRAPDYGILISLLDILVKAPKLFQTKNKYDKCIRNTKTPVEITDFLTGLFTPSEVTLASQFAL